MIVDGADNFPTRYLVNDASVWHGIPVVHGSIYRFEGQVTVFKPHEGPCYRCLFPQPPPPELAPSCAEGGVLGVLPGVIGSLQANEALKLALGIGEPLIGRLLLFDALSARVQRGKLRRDPECPVCGEHPTITEYIDYVEFCAAPGAGMTRSASHRRCARKRAASASSRPKATTVRELLEDLMGRFPALAHQLVEDGEHRAVRERLRRRRGRAHAGRAGNSRPTGADGHPPTRNGRWLAPLALDGSRSQRRCSTSSVTHRSSS